MADEPTPTPAPSPTPAPVAVREPEMFSREYVTEIRNESKGYRLKYQEAEKKAADAAELVEKATKERDERIAESQRTANERIVRAELKAEALKAGMIDLDGLKLADLSKVKLLDDGEIEGAEALMEELKKAKPYLFGSASTSSTEKRPTASDNQPKLATQMTKEEYAAARKKAAAGQL